MRANCNSTTVAFAPRAFNGTGRGAQEGTLNDCILVGTSSEYVEEQLMHVKRMHKWSAILRCSAEGLRVATLNKLHSYQQYRKPRRQAERTLSVKIALCIYKSSPTKSKLRRQAHLTMLTSPTAGGMYIHQRNRFHRHGETAISAPINYPCINSGKNINGPWHRSGRAIRASWRGRWMWEL